MSMPRGINLRPGQVWSVEFPGFIDCGEGAFRKPGVWRGKQVNQYAVLTTCTQCSVRMLHNRSNTQKGNAPFCRIECRSTHIRARHTGSRHKKARPNGHHVEVRQHDHHRANTHGLVYEHILVAEAAAGRPIMPNERVHHINCVKSDNRPENLFVCASQREHFLIHGSLNACIAELLTRGHIKFDPIAKRYQVTEDALSGAA